MRILFFHQGRLSDWAGAILKGLNQQFPGAEIQRFDLAVLLKRRPVLLGASLGAAFVRYGADLVFGRRDLDDALYTTSYLFKEVRRLSKEIHRRHPCAFSFQMHSMHDHSDPRVPHFVYTDFTYENCKDNSGYGQFRWAPRRSERLIGLERTIYENAAAIFTQSETVASKLVSRYRIPQSKVLDVRYGPNLSEQVLREIPIDLKRMSQKKVVFIGKEWIRKGGPELIEAFSKVCHFHPTAKLLILGCRPRINHPFVQILGHVPLEEIPNYYGESCLYCMPSRLEPSASVFVEAMHAGLPVISWRAGAVQELVQDGKTGHLIQQGDIVGLADAICERLSNPQDSMQMGENARAFVNINHRWPEVFQKVGLKIRQCIK